MLRHRDSSLAAVTSTALLAIAACDHAAPDAPDASGAEIDATVPVDAIATYTPVPFEGHYDAHSVLRNKCDRSLGITGSEPMEPGRYPVAIFLVGTSGKYAGTGVVENVLPALARQGFIAASLEYENATLFGAAQNCNLYRDNASCMVRNDDDYVTGERKSALAQLCGRPNADCGKGVVVLGHSQGGMTAVQMLRIPPIEPPSGEPMPELVAAAPIGVGPVGYFAGIQVVDVRACMTFDNIPPTRMFAVNGENDRYFNGPDANQAGGQIALETVTGQHCDPPSWDCRAPESSAAPGTGYALVKPSELTHMRAAHDFMHDFNVSPTVEFAEPNWISPDNAAPWSLYSTARWLRRQVAP